MDDAFDQAVAQLANSHVAQAAGSLEDLIQAPDAPSAWPHWRALERDWHLLGPDGRFLLKQEARRALTDAPDGQRKLAIVKKLPD